MIAQAADRGRLCEVGDDPGEARPGLPCAQPLRGHAGRNGQERDGLPQPQEAVYRVGGRDGLEDRASQGDPNKREESDSRDHDGPTNESARRSGPREAGCEEDRRSGAPCHREHGGERRHPDEESRAAHRDKILGAEPAARCPRIEACRGDEPETDHEDRVAGGDEPPEEARPRAPSDREQRMTDDRRVGPNGGQSDREQDR